MNEEMEKIAADMAPNGTLRIGINHGNPVLAKRDDKTGALSGVAVELGSELGKRIGVPVLLVPFPSAGQMVAALKSARAWDIAFLAAEPGRAGDIDFAPPYIHIEGSYLVPAGSPLEKTAEIDAAGVRIGVSANSAYDLFLSRNLKHAQLVRAPNPNASFGLLSSGKADVIAGVRQSLLANVRNIPGSRVLDGRFMLIEQAIGIAKGHAVGARYLREFVEDVKASGFVLRAIHNAGLNDVMVAPPAE